MLTLENIRNGSGMWKTFIPSFMCVAFWNTMRLHWCNYQQHFANHIFITDGRTFYLQHLIWYIWQQSKQGHLGNHLWESAALKMKCMFIYFPIWTEQNTIKLCKSYKHLSHKQARRYLSLFVTVCCGHWNGQFTLVKCLVCIF